MSATERQRHPHIGVEVKALPRRLHVPNWNGNIRNVLVNRLIEVGYSVTRTPSGKKDDNVNEIIDVTFENTEASFAYHSVFNGSGLRRLREIIDSNPYSPRRVDWVRNGIPEEPSVLRPGTMIPQVLGVNDLVPAPHQLELPAFAALAPQAA